MYHPLHCAISVQNIFSVCLVYYSGLIRMKPFNILLFFPLQFLGELEAYFLISYNQIKQGYTHVSSKTVMHFPMRTQIYTVKA